MNDVRIRPARIEDLRPLADLAAALWPDASPEDHAKHLKPILNDGMVGAMPWAIFVAEAGDHSLAGFVEVDLRSHADGCDHSQPVGYVEGWYVVEGQRHRGIGQQLLAAGEEWARGQGCREMASDTWIDNELSQTVHEALGYEVVDRCVHYRKAL